MPDDKPVGRRRFFRAALVELFKPLEEKAQPLQRAAREWQAAQQRYAPPAAQPPAKAGPVVRAPEGRTAARRVPLAVWHRPPGALPEAKFRETCSQCGRCVEVCPAHCIRLEPNGRGDGFPFIDVDTMPCVVCDGMVCMSSCPSGALMNTPLDDVDMGTAVWDAGHCIRSRREECRICVDQCPQGSLAIELRDDGIQVHADGCIGCGVCEHYCPTTPKSIVVVPRGAREGE